MSAQAANHLASLTRSSSLAVGGAMERVDGLHICPLHACVPPSAVEPLLGAVFKIASRTALTASNTVVAITFAEPGNSNLL